MAGRHWTERASFSFSADDTSLVITLDWGRVIKIDLSSEKSPEALHGQTRGPWPAGDAVCFQRRRCV
jgi:hypothetical protein